MPAMPTGPAAKLFPVGLFPFGGGERERSLIASSPSSPYRGSLPLLLMLEEDAAVLLPEHGELGVRGFRWVRDEVQACLAR